MTDSAFFTKQCLYKVKMLPQLYNFTRAALTMLMTFFMSVRTRDKTGTIRDKKGPTGTKQGQAGTKQGQAGTKQGPAETTFFLQV